MQILSSRYVAGAPNTQFAYLYYQVWFQDLEFRAGVYKCLPELSLAPQKSIEVCACFVY